MYSSFDLVGILYCLLRTGGGVFCLRDCRQITFVTLYRFCPLSKKNPTPSVFNRQYQDEQNTNQNQKKNTCRLYTVFEVLIRYSHQIFYLLLLLLAFTSADITFHKFLKLHSALSEEKIFITNFPFLMDSLKPPPPTSTLPLSESKVICRQSLKLQHELSTYSYTTYYSHTFTYSPSTSYPTFCLSMQ